MGKINLEDFYRPSDKIDLDNFLPKKSDDRVSSKLGLDIDPRVSDVARDRQEDVARLYHVFQDNPNIVDDYKRKLQLNRDDPPSIDANYFRLTYGDNWHKDKSLRDDLNRFKSLNNMKSPYLVNPKVIGSWPPTDLKNKSVAEDLYDVRHRKKALSETENIPGYVEKPLALMAGLEKGVKGAGLTITEIADVVAGTELTDWLDDNWQTIDTGGGVNKVLDVFGQFGLGYGASLKLINGLRRFKRLRKSVVGLKKGEPFRAIGMGERSSKIAGRMGYYSLPALVGDAMVMNLEDKQFGEFFDVYSVGNPDLENLTNRQKAGHRLLRKTIFGLEGFALSAGISAGAKPLIKGLGKVLTTRVKDLVPQVNPYEVKDPVGRFLANAVFDSSIINIPLRTAGMGFKLAAYPVAGVLGPLASGVRAGIAKSGLPPFEQWKFFSTHGDGTLKYWARKISDVSEKLSTAGGLFRDAFDLKMLTEGEIRAISRNVERKMRDIDKAIRSGVERSMQVGSTKSPQSYEHMIEDLVEYWKGAIGGKGAPGKLASELEQEIRKPAVEIYKALNKLKVEGKKLAVNQDQYDIFLDQIKKHFVESHRAFRNPRYKPPKDIMDEAVKRAEATIRDLTKPRFDQFGNIIKGEVLTNAQIKSRATGAINAILKEVGTSKGTSLEMVEVLAKEYGVLKPGEMLPDVMKQLLGKKDARTLLMEVVGGMSQSVWKSHLYKKLHETGMGRWLFNTRTALQDRGISDRLLDKITEEDFVGKRTMFNLGENPLISKEGAEVFMTPEMKKALLDDSLWTDGMLKVPVYRQLLQLKASSQYSKTVLSFMTQVRNVTSAFMFPLANGHVGGGASYIDAYRQIVRDLFGRSGKMDPKALDDYGIELERQNILNSTVIIRDIKDMFKAIAETDAMGGYKLVDDDAFLKFLTESPVMKKLTELYQAGDVIHKIFGYEFSKSQYKAAFNNLDEVSTFFREVIGQPFDRKNLNGTLKTLDEAIQEAAGKTLNNTYPNYNYIPQLVKELRRMPFGNFISFGSEMLRTTGNIANYAFRELASSNPYVRQMGAKRLMGLTSVFAAAPVATAVALKAVGITEEQMEAVKRSLAAPWNKFANLIPYSYTNDPKKGPVVKYINLSYSNPYEIIQQPILTLMGRGTQSDLENKESGTKALEQMFYALDKLLDPFLSEAIISQALLEAKAGETRRGSNIWNYEKDGVGGVAFKSFMHILKALVPTTFVNLSKIEQGAIRQDNATNHRGYTKYGKPVDLKEELLALFAGVRLNEVNVYDTIDFAITDFNERIGEIEKLTRGPQYQNLGYDEKIQEFIKGQKAKYRMYNEFRVLLDDATLLGTSGQTEEEQKKSKAITNLKLKKMLKERQMTKKELNALMRSRFLPISPVDARGNAMKDAIKDIEGATLRGYYPATELKRIEMMLRNIPLLLDSQEFDNYINRALGLPVVDVTPPVEDKGINLQDFYNQSKVEPINMITPPQTIAATPQVATSAARGTDQGLTPTEKALLSPEEQLIKLRQKGISA